MHNNFISNKPYNNGKRNTSKVVSCKSVIENFLLGRHSQPRQDNITFIKEILKAVLFLIEIQRKL